MIRCCLFPQRVQRPIDFSGCFRNIVETPEQMFRRVVNAIASIESRYGASEGDVRAIADEFYELMVDGVFLPNSPTLMNAGRENEMLSACFVLPVEDSVDAIFDTIKNAALIQKAGGGTGFSFDRLRPTGDVVKSSGGKTSGPISFMKVFSEATNAIQQGAFRRGANMGMMSIEHPDILNFIHAKSDPSAFTNFNLSVKVSDAFMRQLKDNPTDHIGRIEATNPCGEQPLLPYEACNLGSINFSKFVIKDRCDLGWDSLAKTIQLAIRFLDNVIDANHYPIPLIEKMTLGNRKIGLLLDMTFTSKCFQKCSYKCSTAFAEMDDTGMISHKPFDFNGLGNGRYWT